ncbi:MAG TPA: cation:proton antiporter [Acidimicrobiales bacterium]
MDLEPLSEHQLLVFWTQFLVLLLTARTLGAVMRLMRQPTVIGELAAGVILGPSLLGEVAPGFSDWLFPDDPRQTALLLAVGWIGVFLLLVDTGFETDLSLIQSLGSAAIRVTVGSLALPLVAGFALGIVIPSMFIGEHDDRITFALFIAVSVSITGLAVTARVLGDLGLTRRNVGQLMLASGMANDAIGWLLLGGIAGLATSEELSPAELLLPLVGMAVFLALAFTVGQRLVDFALRSLRRFDAGITGSLTVTVVVALAAGAATQAIGTEAVLGGFVAGVLLGRSKFQRPETRPHLEGITAAVFAPIFFATAGLRVDLRLLSESDVATWAAVTTAVAFLAKGVGATLGARNANLPLREGVALGLGLNSRGTLEIVVATVGLALGVFNDASYTVILVMVLVTTTIAPPLLRLAFAGWEGTEEEQVRLQREEELARNVVVRTDRILLPSRGGANSRLVARLLHHAWPEGVEATVLSVGKDVDRSEVDLVVAQLRGRPVERKHIGGDDPVAAVLKYAGLGYGVIGVGALERPTDGQIVSPFVDELLARSPLPLVIVRQRRTKAVAAEEPTTEHAIPEPAGSESAGSESAGSEPSTAFRRIMVPAVGTIGARAAQEVAFGVAATLRSELILVHVATRPGAGEAAAAAVVAGPNEPRAEGSGRPRRMSRMLRRRRDVEPVPSSGKEPAAARVVQAALLRAERQGVHASAMIREASSTADELVRCAKEIDADLVFLGATIREVDGHPFLGHNMEHILESLDATVVLVTAPRSTTP